MNVFVKDNKRLLEYYNGVYYLYQQKRKLIRFSDDYDEGYFKDLFNSINALFSKKVGPNDYIPLFESVNVDSLEPEKEQEKQNDILLKMRENMKKGESKFSPNDKNKER